MTKPLARETHVYIRGRVPGDVWASFDLADPDLADGDVMLWLLENGVNAFGVRVVGMLLGRPAVARYGL